MYVEHYTLSFKSCLFQNPGTEAKLDEIKELLANLNAVHGPYTADAPHHVRLKQIPSNVKDAVVS